MKVLSIPTVKFTINMDNSSGEIDVNDDFEEEDLLVYAEFDSVLDEGMLQQNSVFKIIALDTDEPFLQIGAQMYCGKWLDSVGTHLFFEPEEAPPPIDPVFSNVSNNSILNFKFKTRKCLELSRIFVNEKQTDEKADNLNSHSEIETTQKDIEETGEKQVGENGAEVETAASEDGPVQEIQDLQDM